MATRSEILQWATGVVDQYSLQVQHILGLPPVDVTFKFGNTGGDTGETLGHIITLNQDYYNGMNDPGGIIHEYVHAVQDIQGTNVPKNVSEGIADYVRWKMGLTYSGWTPSPMVKQLAKLDTAQIISLANQTAQGNWNASWLTNPASIPLSGSPDYIAPTTTPDTGQGQWQYTGPPGNVSAAGNPTNWKWVGPGKPTTPNPASIFGGVAAGTSDQRIAAFNQVLMSWGIQADAGLKDLISTAAQAGWSTNQFLQKLYTTAEFQQAFPGIFSPNGTLKMSPAQYLANERSYNAYAQRYGVNLGSGQIASLFRNDVSPAEFGIRAQALTTLRTNNQYFTAFNQQLKQQGMQPLTRSEQFQFVMGEGNQQWYDLWNRATARYAAEEAGIHFGNVAKSYTNVPQGFVQKAAGLGLTEHELQAGFQKLAQDFTTLIPMSKARGFNITKQDLFVLRFGGKNQAAIAQRVQQIIENQKMFDQPRAGATLPAFSGQGHAERPIQGPPQSI